MKLGFSFGSVVAFLLVLTSCVSTSFSAPGTKYQASGDYGDAQGTRGWYYQYFDGEQWSPMAWDEDPGRWSYNGTTWCRVEKTWQHPGSDGTESARTWESNLPEGSQAMVRFTAVKRELGGDGVLLRIEQNAATVWGPVTLDSDTALVVELPLVVGPWDQIRFVINSIKNPDYDGVDWDPSIEVRPSGAELERKPPVKSLAQKAEVGKYSFALGERELVRNEALVPIFRWFPDGQISWLPSLDGNSSVMYWAGSSSYRTVGGPAIEDMVLEPRTPVLAKGKKNEPDNGGAWLMSVFRRDGTHLIGFYHAEDHWWGDDVENGLQLAYKSLCVAWSDDDGKTWRKGGRF